MTVAVPPASAGEALGVLTSAMGYLATADATQMAAGVQAACLRGLEQATAVGTVARSSILGAFTAGQGYCEDGAYSPRSWLIHQTRVTRGAAAGHTGWVRRVRAHPRIAAAMAAGSCRSPGPRYLRLVWEEAAQDGRDNADAILAVLPCCGLAWIWAGLAAEMQALSEPGDPATTTPAWTLSTAGRWILTFDALPPPAI